MSFAVAQTYLADILHVVSQALLIPVIALLLCFMAYALFSIGSIVAEYFTERRHFKVVMPKFLAALMEAEQDAIPAVIEESGLLKRQRQALMTVYEYRTLPGDALVALIKRLVSEEESRYDRIRSRNNTAARVSPMIGLMGTLIPLGPGIEALGRADTAALSSSLLIAFDTTVAGLIVAAVCMIIGKIRGNWYDNYLSALDSAMATMLEKIEEMRAAGEIKTKVPENYAFMFGPQAAQAGSELAQAANAQVADQAPVSSMAQQPQPQPQMAAPVAAAPVAAASVAETSDPLELIGIPRVTVTEIDPVETRITAEPAPAATPGPDPVSEYIGGISIGSNDEQPSIQPAQPAPQPAPQPELQPIPQPIPRPELQPIPQPAPQPELQPIPQPEPQPAPQPAPQPDQPADNWAFQAAQPMPSYEPSQEAASSSDVLFEPPRRPR